jgi:hypothetical protein
VTEVPPFLFIVTSTALVLGAMITVRGLLGFRADAEAPALAEASALAVATPLGSSPSSASSDADPATSPEGDTATERDASATPPVTVGPRDLREPIVMTVAGLLIFMLSLVAISSLINSA